MSSETTLKSNTELQNTGTEGIDNFKSYMQSIDGNFAETFERIEEIITILTNDNKESTEGSDKTEGDNLNNDIIEIVNTLCDSLFYKIVGIAKTSYDHFDKILEEKREKNVKLQEIYRKIAIAKQKQTDINEMEVALNERFKVCERTSSDIRNAISEVRKNKGIAPEETDFKVLIEVYFREELQTQLKNWQMLLKMKNSKIRMTKEEQEKVEAQILECKTRILAIVMAYSETNPQKKLGCLEIGFNEPNIDCDSQQLPIALGLVEKVSDKSKSTEEYDFILSESGTEIYAVRKIVAKILEEEYGVNIFESLKKLRIVDSQSFEECANFLLLLKRKKTEYESFENKTAMLLKKYYNIGKVADELEVVGEPEEKRTGDDSQEVKCEYDNEQSSSPVEITEEMCRLTLEHLKQNEWLENKFWWRITPQYCTVKLSDDENLYLRMRGGVKRRPPKGSKKSVQIRTFEELIGEENYLQVQPVLDSLKQNYNKLFQKINELKTLLEKLNEKDITVRSRYILSTTLECLDVILERYKDSIEYMINAIITQCDIEYVEQCAEKVTPTQEKEERTANVVEQKFLERTRLCEEIERAQDNAKDLIGIKTGKDKPKGYKSMTPEQYFKQELENIQCNVAEQLYLLSKKPNFLAKRKIQNEILKYKAQFLAALMMYSETIPSNQLVCCQIGEHQISIDCLLQQLPNVLGIIEPPKNKRNEMRRYPVSELVERELGKKYDEHKGELMNYQVLMIKNCRANGFWTHSAFVEECDGFGCASNEKKTQILLKKYCYNEEIDSMDEPLNIFNVFYPTNPDILTPVSNTEITKLITDIIDKVGDVSKFEWDERE